MARRTALGSLTAGALLLVVLAVPAYGAQGRLDGRTMVYVGDGSEANSAVVTLVDRGGEPHYQLVDPGAVIDTEIPCQPGPDDNTMQCPANLVDDFSASLGDGNDSIRVDTPLPTSIGGGGGGDTMTGGPAADFLRGGDGNDVLAGAAGNDRLDGDGGDDGFEAGGFSDGSDTYNGGDGRDSLGYDERSLPVSVVLDGVTAGGQLGEGDIAAADIEDLTGGAGGDSLTGNGASNSITGNGGADAIAGGGGADALGGGIGRDTLSGGDDDDALDGGADPDRLDGGAGADSLGGGDGRDLADYGARAENLTVTLDGVAGDGAAGEGDNVQGDVEDVLGGAGADTFTGSAAANSLEGGAGEDYMDGAAGADALTGGAAGDVLRTRDGEGDQLGCGPGPDFVIGDPGDANAADCERVDPGVRQRPQTRDSAVVAPARGTLAMSPAGISRTVPLQDTVVLPLRSLVDAGQGAVDVTSTRDRLGRSQTAQFYEGAFRVAQTAGRNPITEMALDGGDFGSCPAASRRRAARSSQSRTKTVRRLWGNGKGRFRTRGRYGVASVRGTRWLTEDRCDGTLIRVRQGSVTVRDLVARRTVIVRAGRSYLARAR